MHVSPFATQSCFAQCMGISTWNNAELGLRVSGLGSELHITKDETEIETGVTQRF